MPDLSDKERDKLAEDEDVDNVDIITNILKLYHLDGDYPLFLKINNIIILFLYPMFLLYDMVGIVIGLPLTNIISIESLGLLFCSWVCIVCVVGIGYYSVKRYKIVTKEEHIATVELFEQTYSVYTTNQVYDSSTNEIDSEEYNNTYILLNTTHLIPPPINRYTYDNKKIINIFCYMIGINVVTERDLVYYILDNYEKEEIETIFEQENTELSKSISSQIVLQNI